MTSYLFSAIYDDLDHTNHIFSESLYKVLPTPNIYCIFSKAGCSRISNIAFHPKVSTKKIPHKFFTGHFPPKLILGHVYSKPEYLSFARFTWSRVSLPLYLYLLFFSRPAVDMVGPSVAVVVATGTTMGSIVNIRCFYSRSRFNFR